MRIAAIYTSPVKSFALRRHEEAVVTPRGIEGDRALYVVDPDGRLVTQRECGALALVRADYDAASGHLRLTFPDGSAVEGVAGGRDSTTTRFFGREREAILVDGPFAGALSTYAQRQLRFVKAPPDAAAGFDAFPISVLSDASVTKLKTVSESDGLSERRFRPNLYVAGAPEPHAEDGWIGRTVQAGEALLRVVMRDPRCVMTTLDPDSGRPDLDTLKLIASYRTDQPKEVNFGVYATVERPGRVRVGDEVRLAAAEEVAGHDGV